MAIYKFNKYTSGEEYDRWKAYIESKDPTAIVLPECIDIIDTPMEDKGFTCTLDDGSNTEE